MANRKNTAVPSNQLGCMGAMIRHFFDFNQNLRLPKMLLDRRHGEGRRSSGMKERKFREDVSSTSKRHEPVHNRSRNSSTFAKFAQFQTENEYEDTSEVTPELPTNELSVSSSHMSRTFSLHHLRCDDFVQAEEMPNDGSGTDSSFSGECVNATLKSPVESSNSSSEGQIQHNDLSLNMVESRAIVQEKHPQSDEFKDNFQGNSAMDRAKNLLTTLELFNANRKTFFKIIDNPSYLSEKYLQELEKSNSFPLDGLSGLKDTELSDKTRISLAMLDSFSSDIETNYRISNASEPVYSPEFSPSPRHELKRQRSVTNGPRYHFKDIRHRIKYLIKESKSNGKRISMDGIFHRIPYGHKLSQYLSVRNKCGLKKNLNGWSSSPDKRPSPSSFAKCRSLNESFDKYSCLLTPNSSKEGTSFSERLKLINEDSPKTSAKLPRIRSLPEFQTYVGRADSFTRFSSIDFGERNAKVDVGPRHKMKLTNNISNEPNVALKKEKLEHVMDSKLDSGGIVEESLLCSSDESSEEADNFDDFPKERTIIYDTLHELDTGPSLDDVKEPDESSPHSKTSGSEVTSEMESQSDDSNIQNIANDNSNNTLLQTKPIPCDIEETNDDGFEAISNQNSHILNSLHAQVSSKDEDESIYVHNILKKSGYNGNDISGRFYSPDIPINPSLFEELEGPNCGVDFSRYEAGLNLQHLLLFDLINQVLLEMYDASCGAHPWLARFNSNSKLAPMRSNVTEEVWAAISWHLSCQPQLDHTVDYVLARDMSKTDRWMNIGYDVEDVGIEIEEMVWDDLQDEVVFEILSGLEIK